MIQRGTIPYTTKKESSADKHIFQIISLLKSEAECINTLSDGGKRLQRTIRLCLSDLIRG